MGTLSLMPTICLSGMIVFHVALFFVLNVCLSCGGCCLRQQGGILVAGPGASSISYIHKVI